MSATTAVGTCVPALPSSGVAALAAATAAAAPIGPAASMAAAAVSTHDRKLGPSARVSPLTCAAAAVAAAIFTATAGIQELRAVAVAAAAAVAPAPAPAAVAAAVSVAFSHSPGLGTAAPAFAPTASGAAASHAKVPDDVTRVTRIMLRGNKTIMGRAILDAPAQAKKQQQTAIQTGSKGATGTMLFFVREFGLATVGRHNTHASPLGSTAKVGHCGRLGMASFCPWQNTSRASGRTCLMSFMSCNGIGK
mmetsp:Transcript_50487/g.127268  ORF Transcript_50487/g.127268 Transcript_50487/m.127268 type:complete len:250 (-) Transcript_50487:570-1319(-)